MTRESKLALIIGFVLVLIVGVLVSDHFSQASSMSLDTQSQANEQLNMPSSRLGERDQLAIQQGIPGSFEPFTADGLSTGSSDQYQPVEISSRHSNTTGSLLDDAITKAKEIAQNAELVPTVQEVRDPIGSDRQRKLPEPRSVSYTVEAGDSLIKIARRFLNDSERWREIHELNADRLGPDAILKVGMTLRLPADARISTSSATNKPSGSRRATSTTQYTVVSGDTLGEISMKILGTSRRADEIAELNGLSSPNEIYVGMTLKVPAK